MHPDVRKALSLQEIDRRIVEIEREVATLPKQIAEIEKVLYSHAKKLELDRAAVQANLRDRKGLEGDIQTNTQKISKLRDQMMGAKITNEQYRAFQHEIEFCEKAIRTAEDRILDLMGEAEPLEHNVKAAEGALAAERKAVEAEKQKATARTNADRAELAKCHAERERLAGEIAKPVLASYERLRVRQKDGYAIVEVVNGLCLGCQMLLRPQFFEEVKRGSEVTFCENCKRILYYTPPAEQFDQDVANPASSTQSASR